MSARPAVWPPLLQGAVLVVLSIALHAEPLLRLVEMREPNGYAHVDFAAAMANTHVLYPGHFLYHVLTVATQAMTSLSWLQAHFVVVLAMRVLLSVIVWQLVRKSMATRETAADALGALALTFAATFASPISFPTWPIGNYYIGYIVPNLTVSQTLVAMQPLALLTFARLTQVMAATPLSPSGRDLLAIATLASLSALAKPSYVMVLLPVLPLLLLVRNSSGRSRSWVRDQLPALRLVLSLALPLIAVVAWVYLSTYLAVQGVTASQASGMRIAPFEVMTALEAGHGTGRHVAAWLAAKLVLSLAFPAVVAIAYFRQARHDVRFQLAWLQMAAGLFFMYALTEYPMGGAGNFTWSAHAAVSILFVVSLLVLVEQSLPGAPSRWRAMWATPSAALCYAALLLHVLAGLALHVNPEVS